ncbi:hypothetical protein IKE13_02425 [Candidatus Saccharibacteria bacterium]|nr:hypothetical protein [Candidatus Saccharibacteria bacterium]
MFVAIVLVVVFLLLNIFMPKEVYISDNNEPETIGSLYCKSSSPGGVFFNSDKVKSAEHEIKITMLDDKVDKMNYTYTGIFESREETEKELSKMHADYNIYMSGTNIYQEDLYPTFSNLETKGVINLYIQNNTLNSATAKLMFLSNDEYSQFDKYDLEMLEKVYNDKGFVCVITK